MLDAGEKQLGTVPNLFRLIGRSPAALDVFLSFAPALGRALDVKTRNRIALATAQANGCDYCLSAHSYLGATLAKLDDAEIAANRAGRSSDPKANAAPTFAAKVVCERGRVSDADVVVVKLAGYDDAQVIEIVANVALIVFTSFLNDVADSEVDFPVVRVEAS